MVPAIPPEDYLRIPQRSGVQSKLVNSTTTSLAIYMCHGVPWRIVIFCAAVYIRPTPWPTTSLVLLFVNCTIPPHCSTIPTIWTKNIDSEFGTASTVLVYLSTIDTLSHDTSCRFNFALT